MYRQALELVSESESSRQDICSELAEALLCRHQLFHQSSDHNEAIDLYMQDPEFQHPSHSIKYPNVYNIMGNATLRTSYQERPDDIYPQPSLAGVEECILLQKMAFELLPLSHPLRPRILDVLAGILIYQYVSNVNSGNSTNLEGYFDEAISLRKQALKLISPSNPSHQGILLSLADALYFRHSFQMSGPLSDLDEAILIHRRILDILPSSHSHQLTILKCLALELSRRYKKEKQLSDLDEAILLFKQCLQLPLPFRPDRPDILDALADALFERNTPPGDIDEVMLLDLAMESPNWCKKYPRNILRWSEKAIIFQSQALEILLPSDHRRVDILCDLAETRLILRTKIDGPPRSLDASTPGQTELGNKLEQEHPSQKTNQLGSDNSTDAVSLYRQALELISPSHPRRFHALRRLSEILVDQYEDEGELALLEEAILLQNQALELRLPPHPDYLDILSNLANTLACRYEQEREITDLYNSISLNKQVLESCPSDLPPKKRFALLSNLAHALACRFEVEGQMNDLDEAISLNRQAIGIPLQPHEIQAAFINLGNALSRRFEQGKQIADLDETINIARFAISRLSSYNPEISQFYGSLRVALKLRSELTGQTDDAQTSWPQATPAISHLDRYLALGSPSQSDAPADNPVTSSAGSRFMKGDRVNPDKLSLHHQTDDKKTASQSNSKVILATRNLQYLPTCLPKERGSLSVDGACQAQALFPIKKPSKNSCK